MHRNIHRPIAPAMFPCPHCSTTFSRQEHLQRHLQRHTGLRLFECHVCSKKFPRRDTLRRHMVVHGQLAIRNFDEAEARSRNNQTACSNCAKAKQACNGQQPCSRCQKRHVVCTYVRRQSSHRELDQPMDPNTPFSSSSEATLPRTDDETSGLLPVSSCFPTTAYSMGDVAFSVLAESPVIGSQQSLGESTAMSNSSPFSNYASTTSDMESYALENVGTTAFNALATSGPPHDFRFDYMPWDEIPSLSFYAFDFDAAPLYPDLSFQQHFSSAMPPEGERQREAALEPSTVSQPSYLTPKPYEFPHLPAHLLQGFCNGIYCHIPYSNILQQAHKQASEFFYVIHDHHPLGDQIRPPFLPFAVFNALIQLYFEHFHPVWPFIHPSLLAQPETSWILFLGVAAMGARYVVAGPMDHVVVATRTLHRDAILHHLPKSPNEGALTYAQSVLLHHISLAYDGTQSTFTHLYHERGILTTLCQNRIESKSYLRRDGRAGQGQWESWIATQSNSWFIYSVWLFECLGHMFFGIRPLILVADLDVPLPEQGSLWDAIDCPEWQSLLEKRSGCASFSNHGREIVVAGEVSIRELSLRNVLHDSAALQRMLADSDGFCRILLLTTMFSEEKIELHRTKSWLADRISQPSTLARHRAAGQEYLDRGTPPRLQNRIQAMDADFNLLHHRLTSSLPTTDFNIIEVCMYHTIQILRHVRLQAIYALTGWQATEAHVDIAKREFKLWLNHDKPTTRKCLWHAAVLFSTLHARRHMALWEPFYALIGGIFLWGYIMSADGKSIQASSSPSPTVSRRALRLDRLTDGDDLRAWIEQGFDGDIHVTGIGKISPGEHPIRVLEELHACLMPQTRTVNLAVGIAKAIMQVCHGLLPSFQDLDVVQNMSENPIQ